MADAVLSAKSGQKTPAGYYSVERMLKRLVAGQRQVLLCGTCMDARGVAPTRFSSSEKDARQGAEFSVSATLMMGAR
ncbi:MAG TPA: DsrE family protein [Rhodoblastus sp.]|nr:DsrE family protein [Rhodoblastus sp.]